jgi:glutamate-1-semialdehyde 2,1-aminomutase
MIFSKGKENMTDLILVNSIYLIAFIFSIKFIFLAKQRLELSFAKNPSLGGHVRWSKRFARLIPAYSYGEDRWFSCDDAPISVVNQRKSALAQLSDDLVKQSPFTLERTVETKPMISDLQFTSNYRVPYQFTKVLQKYIQIGGFWKESKGVWLTDLDGNRFIDVTGSYGVNLFGLDFYKSCIQEGSELVSDLGPTLGSYHPCVLDNVKRLCALSGKDEVSFHMSGTEAVMQAVRLARYHTAKQKIVRFCGAYHGWWDDVQPGPGNPMQPASQTLTLREMHDSTLRVLRNRNDIACVLVNPLQALHPNQAAPGDSTLVDGSRKAHFDFDGYKAWLTQLREVCTAKGIVLIFDEVFLGFRLAKGGAQEYFGIQADIVTYGKTLGGGLPVGVICGKAELMRRYRDDRPADICFARGTFNAHPYVMGAMNVFLKRLDSQEISNQYATLDSVWNSRAKELNALLKSHGLPIQVANMSTVWTVLINSESRFNWMLQYYLRREGVALSWVGTGRMIFSLNFRDQDFQDFMNKFIAAAQRMSNDGWFWKAPEQTNKSIRRGMLLEMIKVRLA